jgi:hypothetical protein
LAVLSFGCRGTLALAATPPRLDFDVPFCVSCRRVPCADSARKDPGKDLVEVVLPVSVRVRAGTEKDLKECLYTLVNAADPPVLSVRDWLPRTELKTEFAKPIQVNKERLAKVGITVSAHYAVTASGDALGQIKSAVAYEMLPPQEIVLASGTLHHAHGLFFKLKPSTQTALEGMKSFSAIFAAPHGWRGGCLRLECQAVGLNRGLLRPLDREVDCGRAVFWVALYVSGDAQAAALADRVGTCQQKLLDCLQTGRRSVGPAWGKCLPFLGRLVGRPGYLERHSPGADEVLDGDEPALLHHVLDRATTPARPAEELPGPVREKLRAFGEAVRALQHLSAGNPRAADRSERVSAKAPSLGTSAAFAHAEKARPSPGAPRPASVGSIAKAAALASDGKETITGSQAAPEKACQVDRSSAGTVKHPWYILASIGGAVFTCILAPVVVEVIRKRINSGH